MPFIKEFFFSLIREYGGSAIFFSLMLEYIGLPVPGESLMLLLGFLDAGKGIAASVIWAVAGTFSGSMAAYAIGRRYGEKAILKIGKPFHLTKEKLDQADRLLRSHEMQTIIFSRFIPGVRHVVPYMSGIAKVDVKKNALYNLVSSVIWCGCFLLLGSVTGSNWTVIGKAVGAYTLATLTLLLFSFLVFKYFGRFRLPVFVLSALVIAFILFASEMMEHELSAFDSLAYSRLSELITENRTDLMRLISDFGSVYFFGAITAVILAVAKIRKKPLFYANAAAVNLVLVSILNIVFKTIFRRTRPDILRLVSAAGFSFPSGHSMISAAFYGYLIYLCILFVKRPWKQLLSAALSALILAIGISRIYLGVHYASDVIGGYLAGFSWLVMFIILTGAYRKIVPEQAAAEERRNL